MRSPDPLSPRGPSPFSPFPVRRAQKQIPSSESNTLVDYTYVGLAWQVLVGYAGPAVELTYIQQSGEPVGDAGDPYNGYDCFGRTVDIRWQSATTDNTQLERLLYGFDRDSRRTWRQRVLTTGLDNAYDYDGLSQVTRNAIGNLNLNTTAISGIPAQNEAWRYDPTGNWNAYQTQANETVTLDQTRVYDKGNRLTQISGDPEPVLLDQVGRILQVSPDATGDWTRSLVLQWDAWSRIVQISESESVITNYTYDGLSRRLTKTTDGVTLHTYYSDAWRPLEERIDLQITPSAQYLWGARHRDDLVRRDRATTSGGTLDETRYVLMGYFNPASIVDETGAVTERYAFSSFGIRTILAPDFVPIASSECAWDFAFQGQFLDEESGLLNYGYRYYSPPLGRWLSKDPIDEAGGLNLYAYALNNPITGVDLFGLGPQLPEFPPGTTPEQMRQMAQATQEAATNATNAAAPGSNAANTAKALQDIADAEATAATEAELAAAGGMTTAEAISALVPPVGLGLCVISICVGVISSHPGYLPKKPLFYGK